MYIGKDTISGSSVFCSKQSLALAKLFLLNLEYFKEDCLDYGTV